MTWRRVGVIYLVLAVLAAWFVAVELRPARTDHTHDPGAPERSLLGVDAAAVVRLALRRDGTTITVARDDDRWRVVEPAAVAVPPDLIAALVATLTAGQVSEVMTREAGGDAAAFGLAAPAAAIDVTLRDVPAPIHVLLGGTNPTKTALYAERTDDRAIYLVGLNVRYYSDLIFDSAHR